MQPRRSRNARTRTLIAVAAAFVGATAVLLGGALRNGADAQAKTTDAHTLADLGLQYEQRARETANPAYLTRAEGVLRRALELEPRNAKATVGIASLALSRHEFRRALRLGHRARRLAPEAPAPYAIVGDALVELGRYRGAIRAFDAMARRKPGVAAYARVAYARELLGNRRGAVAAIGLAVAAAAGQGEPEAWSRVELGKLHFGSGRLDAAARQYRAALRALPGYVFALDALAHVEAARGRFAGAAALSRRALQSVPLPQFAATLGDVLWVSGRRAEARDQYALIGAVERLLRANGVRSDLEIADFYADRGLHTRRALDLARRAYRPSIHGDDVLAWTLYRNGRCVDALRHSQRALRLGTRDAATFFRRGMIELCLGDGDEGRRWLRRALSLNPHFSLRWSPIARRLAA